MKVIKAYSISLIKGCMSLCPGPYYLLLIFFLTFSFNVRLYPQDLPEYDEVVIFVGLQGYGGSEINCLVKDADLFIPVTDLFNFLRIKNDPSSDLETISGFFVNPEAKYVIDRTKNKITYQGKIFDLNVGDLIRTESNLFLRSTYFGKIFGLDCKFNFRALDVTVTSRLELPVIREMKQEEMRKNIARLKGEVRADTVIGRTYPLFQTGMADWSVYTSQEINGRSDTRVNLDLGAMIAGGEATASLYYNNSNTFNEKQQRYLWRYVNNDFSPLRQVIAGKIQTGAMSSIYNPVIGIQLTNTPTTYRRSFGTYTLADRTEPGWVVELYVNNVLVDFIKADASGFYTFQVPLVYGNSLVKLKFFGPWGEERTHEQTIVIPYNFLPEKTFEYIVSAGIVEDTAASRFSRASFNYGATRNLTLGGGAEYLSSISSQPFMPYVNASYRITNNFLVSGEYAPGVRAKGTLSYRLPSNMQLDIDYTWYDKEQKAIYYNYREERRAMLSVPIKIGKFTSFNRFSFNQIILPASKYTTGEWLISGSLFGVNTNLTTYAIFLGESDPYIYSNLSAAFRLPAAFTVMPQMQYSYNENKMLSAKMRIEKPVLKHGHLYISYEQNFRNDLRLAEAGMRYDFSFAQAGASIRRYDNRTSFIEYARGSLIHDRKTKYLGGDNRTNVGRGGITVAAFIDLNSNGRKDAGEPGAAGLNLRSSGGRIEISERDTVIRILGLEPYTSCFIELDPNSFDNVSWRLQKTTYNVIVDPDILKTIEVPVSITGEATGFVYIDEKGQRKGQGRMIVRFLDSKNTLAGTTLSEDDGYYSFFGLKPGIYTARIDTGQLKKLGMSSDPISRRFSIKGSIDGDIADGLDFTVRTLPADTTVKESVLPETPVATKDTSYLILHEMSEEVYTITEDSWAIQIGAFKSKEYAEGFKEMLERELGKEVQITVAGDYYRVRILDLPTRTEVDENVKKLNKLGFKELWIIHLLARQQQILLVPKTDSLAVVREIPLTEAEIAEMSLGAFRLRTEAAALSKGLSAPLTKKGIIEYRGRYYKLETPGQPILNPTILEAIDELLPDVGRFELRDEWYNPLRKMAVAEEPKSERMPITVEKAPVKSVQMVSVTSSLSGRLVYVEKPAATIPSVALQVAIFHKESQAIRAQKRIMSKLNLPVEIVKQWDYYHVLVTGFYSREETYPYYPELAGMGYPGITLIENFRRQK